MLAYEKQKKQASDSSFQKSKTTAQKKENEKPIVEPNLTGIPGTMKSRFENLSGLSFDDVRVHYNSGEQAQLQALAYTQENQVYVGPGHELGHVVQQKRGIVNPTTSLNGINVNDNEKLEEKADGISRYSHKDRAMKNTVQGNSMVVQRKKIKEYSPSVLSPFQPLLWSNEKYNIFLKHYEDEEVGEPLPDLEIMKNLIQKFQTPAIVHRGENKGTFQSSLKPHNLFDLWEQMPQSRENYLAEGTPFHPGLHLHLGFGSICVLERLSPKEPYRILRVLKYNTSNCKLLEERDVMKEFIDPLIDKCKALVNRANLSEDAKRKFKLLSEAETLIGKIRAHNLTGPLVSSVVTSAISSCTFAAMSDREQSYMIIFHLDSKHSMPSAKIKEVLEAAGVADVQIRNLFISKIEGTEEEEKYRRVKEDLMGMQGESEPALHITHLDRGQAGDGFFSQRHDRIGVDLSLGPIIIGQQGTPLEEALQKLKDMILDSSNLQKFVNIARLSIPKKLIDLIANLEYARSEKWTKRVKKKLLASYLN